jgi:hypothetical protein
MPSLLRNIRLGCNRAALGEGGTKMEYAIFKAFEIVAGVGAFTLLYCKGFAFLSSIQITWKK